MSAPDPSEIELRAPLPGNALAATLTFQAPRGGLAPGYRAVPRSEATHAELRLKTLSGKTEDRRMEIAEALAWLAEAEALHDRDRRLTAAGAGRRDEAKAARAERSARIVPTCPHCQVPRRYEGRRDLVSAGKPEHIARADNIQFMRPEARPYEEYACPECGSVEFFRAGALDHPLPGAAS